MTTTTRATSPLSLFGALPPAAPDDVPADAMPKADAPASTAPDVPAWVHSRQRSDDATLAAVAAAQDLLAPVFRGKFPYDSPLTDLYSAFGRCDKLAASLWEHALTELTAQAQADFAHPLGLPLTIDADEVAEHFGWGRSNRYERQRARERWEWEQERRDRFGEEADAAPVPPEDPPRPTYAEIWRYLAATYNTTSTKDAAAEQAIHTFIKEILRDGSPHRGIPTPVWRSGHLVLTCRVYTSRWSGRVEYSYNTVSQIVKLLGHLQDVCTLLEHPVTGGIVAAKRHDWSNFRSRARHTFVGGFRAVTFQEKIEMEIPPGAAEALMALVAPHLAG